MLSRGRALFTRVTTLGCALALALPGTLAAVDNYYVPPAGGDWSTSLNWSLGHEPTSANDALILVSGPAHKSVYFDVSSAGFGDLTIDGGVSGHYGALWQLQGSILAENVYLGQTGEAWHWMEADALLWSLGDLYVGQYDPGEGHFYLAAVDYGVLVNDDTYVGYSAPGDFDHLNGYHSCSHLFVGQNDPGTYWLKGSEATSTLNPDWYIVVGNGDVGLFEQTGGTVTQSDNGSFLVVGLNPGGEGTYLMKGGVLNTYSVSIGYSGDGYFTQSAGTVNLETDLHISAMGNSPHRAWYKLNETDGVAELNVGRDLVVGQFSLAKYEQTGGTATVGDDLRIYEDPNSGTYSYVYLGTSAGLLEVQGEVINQSGYYDQDGGVLNTPSFTNNSPYGFNLDNSADFRANTVQHNAGTLYMWRNAQLRGKQVLPGVFFLCNLTNDANIQMGNATFDGGTFTGNLINNGSFNYTQGDFSDSTLTNYGTVNLNAPFLCRRFVQNAYAYTVPTSPITVSGTGYASAFESNGNLTIPAGCVINVQDAPLVSNGPLYAEGSVSGDLVNNDYLLPSMTSTASGDFEVQGDYTATGTAQLRIRISGPSAGDYDELNVLGAATLAGTLDVRLTNGFVPQLGDRFYPVTWASRSGTFNPVLLPPLPAGLDWTVSYGTSSLRLAVVAAPDCPGDVNGDGVVDLTDLSIVLANFGASGVPPGQGDLTGDGVVDLSDLSEVLAVFGSTC